MGMVRRLRLLPANCLVVSISEEAGRRSSLLQGSRAPRTPDDIQIPGIGPLPIQRRSMGARFRIAMAEANGAGVSGGWMVLVVVRPFRAILQRWDG